MKKIIILLIIILGTLNVNAQFLGGFYHADPNAWIDKEPYFACKNTFIYNGWGQNLQNIYVVINGSDIYSFPYVWEYGKYITIGKANGIDFSSGDTVSLYWGNQCLGTWIYRPSSTLQDRRIKGSKNANKVLKSTWKFIKRIR